MAIKANFSGFESYQLTEVRVTDRELGHGSYATVQELEYMGLKCAGKKIHLVLLRQGEDSYCVHRFEEECRLLSQVRHPNIVQFLGVHFQQEMEAPILVMEFLPTNLTSCIEQYGILPKEISYSVLHDVALGLCYLHNLTPPITHRDLCSNNVLLTANMTAKISDLGVARILSVTPLLRMTQTPGTPAYMPPEVMVANPKYDTSVDEFSYGILMIHMFSGSWPEPQLGPVRIESGRMIPVSEAERREVFLRAIGNEHPLMDLILRLINNDPQIRPHACEIVERLAAMVLQFPASFANRLEMLIHVQDQEKEKKILRKQLWAKKLALREEREAKNHASRQEVSKLSRNEEKAEEIDQLFFSPSSEVEEFKLQVKDINLQIEQFKVERKAENKEMKTKIALCEDKLQTKDEAMSKEREEYASQLAEERKLLEAQIADLQSQLTDLETDIKKERVKLETQLKNYEVRLSSERESCKRLTSEISCSLQQQVLNLEAESSTKDATIRRKDNELETANKALEENKSVILDMRQQLTKAREYLTSKSPVSRFSINALLICVWMHGENCIILV